MARGRPLVWVVMANRHRFGVFFAGSALSNIGTWCQNIAGILVIYRLTGSTLMVGLVTVAQFAAPVLLAPWSGIVADRCDRRRILTLSQLGGAAVSALLALAALTGQASVPLVLGALAALGIFQAFQSPAQLALVPLLVTPSQREMGLSLGSMQFNLARVIGPIVASGIIVLWDVWVAFAFNAASYFAYVIALAVIRPAEQGRLKDVPRLRHTLDALRADKMIFPLLLVGLISSGATDAINTLGPGLSGRISGDDQAVGLFVSAFGAGAVLSGLLLVPALQTVPRRLPWTLAAQGLGLLLFIFAPSVGLAMLGAAISGAGFLASSNRALAMVQQRAAPAVLGRITAVWLMAFLGGRSLFAAGGGLLASRFDLRISGVFSAALVALTVVLAVWAERRAEGGS